MLTSELWRFPSAQAAAAGTPTLLRGLLRQVSPCGRSLCSPDRWGCPPTSPCSQRCTRPWTAAAGTQAAPVDPAGSWGPGPSSGPARPQSAWIGTNTLRWTRSPGRARGCPRSRFCPGNVSRTAGKHAGPLRGPPADPHRRRSGSSRESDPPARRQTCFLLHTHTQ